MKTLKKITLLLTLIAFISIQGFSQSVAVKENKQTTKTSQAPAGNPGKFVDNNKDGICDNHQGKVKSDKCGKFIDRNNDGVCDNCKGKGNCCGYDCKKGCSNVKGNCCGNGNGNKNRHGCSGQNSNTAQPAGTGDKK